MRTLVGSSKIVARSRAQSLPACDRSGVTFTFCANAVVPQSASTNPP